MEAIDWNEWVDLYATDPEKYSGLMVGPVGHGVRIGMFKLAEAIKLATGWDPGSLRWSSATILRDSGPPLKIDEMMELAKRADFPALKRRHGETT